MKPEGKPRYRWDWLQSAWIITNWRWITPKFKQKVK